MRIITEELIKEAIELVRPSAEKILNSRGTTWGPAWVTGVVKAPGVDIIIKFYFGSEPKKKKVVREINFAEIAYKKLFVAEREGLNTSVVVATKPWQLKEGEYLYAGGATRDGISVAVSGAMARTDEAIAEIVISTIVMLAHLETERRIKKRKEQI